MRKFSSVNSGSGRAIPTTQPVVENPVTDTSYRSSEIFRWVRSRRPGARGVLSVATKLPAHWSEHSHVRYVWGLDLWVPLGSVIRFLGVFDGKFGCLWLFSMQQRVPFLGLFCAET